MGVVTRVIDGDSVEIDVDDDILEVRLDGINAPDRGECFARESLDHLTEEALGRSVSLEIRADDQFGRSLAIIRLEGRDLNFEMVERGLAIATTSGGDDSYLRAEESAYAARTGLWNANACGESPGSVLAIVTGGSMPDPPGPDEDSLDSEGVAIRNTSGEAVDLTGWSLRDESSRHRYHFGSGETIDPGETWFVSSGERGWDPGGSPVWNNGGDIALLLDPNGNVIARWRY